MPTSRPIRAGEWLLCLRGDVAQKIATGNEDPNNYVLQEDFGIHRMAHDPFWLNSGERVFAVPGVRVKSDPRLTAAITNGTAPGLYVREGDDTSDWETYRQVLARRVEEAMAARRGGEVTATRPSSPPIHECPWCYNSRRITHSQDDDGRICPYCFDWPEVVQAREDAAALAAARAMPTATTRQNPADVRKVSSPPQTVADVSGIEAAVSDEVRRRISSPLVSDETTRQRVVSPVPPAPAVDVRLQFGGERETTASRIRQEVQRELDRQYGRIDASSSPSPPPTLPSPPSRFGLLEIDTDTDAKDASPSPSNAPVDLAALQAELRAEREARRALAAAQTPPGRFDLLECDLPAVVVKTSTKATKTAQARPAASSPPPRRPVETITDLTAARSPLELARMLEGLNDELSTMMRRREAN